MTPEELLQGRVKCIGGPEHYPGSQFQIGEILYADKDGSFWVYEDWGKWQLQPENYPHLFQKLNWWEERNIEDMPEYVKINDEVKNSVLSIEGETEPSIHKVKRHWALSMDADFRNSTYSGFISEWHEHQYSYGQFLPATIT